MTVRHATAATPAVLAHVASGPASAPQSAASTTTVRGPPPGGVKSSVTTLAAAAALKPAAPSHERSDTSTDSPGAANGRFVVPTVPANASVRCGIKLQAARASAPSARTTSGASRAEVRFRCMSGARENGRSRLLPCFPPS